MKRNTGFLFLLVVGFYLQTFAQETETITKHELQAIVGFLASDELKGRKMSTDNERIAAQYITSRLVEANIPPFFETYLDSFNHKGKTGVNVVGLIKGHDPVLKNEYVLLGAHYDHIGIEKNTQKDAINNGANDNASGTASVLAIAKQLARQHHKRSVIIALFSGEESGLLGSKSLANKLKLQGIDLYLMLNFEMIGVPFTDRDYDVFVTGYDLSNLAPSLNTYTSSTMVGQSELSRRYDLFKRSDNFAFYKQFKAPSHTISSSDLSNYDYYHHVGDETFRIDFDFMTKTLNKLIPGIETICNTKTKTIKMYETN
jgi:hypothetical protein